MTYYDNNKNAVIPRPNWFFDGGVPVDDAFLADKGIYPLSDVRPADTAFARYNRGGYVVADGVATVEYIKVDRDIEDAKSWLKNVVTTRRFDHETKGIEINGAYVATDRDSQAKINGAFNLASYNLDTTIDFKGANGWVALSGAEMLGIGVAVGRHVQACFSKERALHEAIDACEDLAALELIDIEAGWPGMPEPVVEEPVTEEPAPEQPAAE